jgi:hypothetical protein
VTASVLLVLLEPGMVLQYCRLVFCGVEGMRGRSCFLCAVVSCHCRVFRGASEPRQKALGRTKTQSFIPTSNEQLVFNLAQEH